jgi:hypothetical protein
MLLFLLPPSAFPEVDVYRAQAEAATAAGGCQCGCATISLSVPDSAPRTAVKGTTSLPIEAPSRDPNDGSITTQTILLAREGALRTLELCWYTDTPPRDFPSPQQLELIDRST